MRNKTKSWWDHLVDDSVMIAATVAIMIAMMALLSVVAVAVLISKILDVIK